MTLGLVGLAGCGDAAEQRAGTSGPTTAAETETPVERPYVPSDGSPLDDHRGVVLVNRGRTPRFVTLAVTHEGRELYVDSTTVDPGNRLAVPDLVGGTGTYGVVVETSDGARTTYDWPVTGETGNLVASVDDGVTVRRQAVCDPDCAPFSTVASSNQGTAGSSVDRKRLALVNPGASRRTASLRATADGGEVLAATYRVPAQTRLEIPVPGEPFRYQVAVTVDGERRTHQWRTLPGGALRVTIGDAVSFACESGRRDLRVRNETAKRRTVTVTVRTGDDSVEHTVVLDAGAVETARRLVPPGVKTFRVETDRGERVRRPVEVCPPPGPVWVAVKPAGIQLSVAPDGPT
jgi:hypothetical protein